MDELYWVWLSMALKPGARVKSLINFYGNPYSIYDASDVDLYLCPFLKAAQTEEILECDIEEAQSIVETCKRNGWKIITPDSGLYPKRLMEIENYPLVLYVCGDIPDLNKCFSMSIVGTRKASNFGITSAYNISCDLAAENTVIVSGGALGVDSAAHKGAMARGGKTIAVLGNGLGYEYPRENIKLRSLISENGALITEFPPYSHPTRQTFPIRNRIISGMSEGVIVIEAGVKSGSLITAEYAAEQGRKIFVLSGGSEHNIKSRYAGNEMLISDGRGIKIETAADIMAEYGKIIEIAPHYETARFVNINETVERKYNLNKKFDDLKDEKRRLLTEELTNDVDKRSFSDSDFQENRQNIDKRKKDREDTSKKQKRNMAKLSENAARVYEQLRNTPMEADELIDCLEISMNELMTAILELQLRKYIKNDFGQKYSVV